jgi:hypothetical protein
MADAALPPASEKLRTVLDYVPCEACLSQRVEDQELLCSVCRRLDRDVGVRIAVTTTVLVDRPAEPGPVIIPPPGGSSLPPVEVRFVEPGQRVRKEKGAPSATEVFVAPLEEPSPPVAAAAPPLPPEPAPEAEDEAEWGDVVSFQQPASDAFEFTRPGAEPPPPEPEEGPAPPVWEDDHVFRPPAPDERPEEEPEPAPPPAEDAQWMRPEEDDDEPILEATVVEDEPSAAEPNAERSDLWRLGGFDAGAERALGEKGVGEISHLSGHDANDLAARTGVDARRLAAWVDVADLKQEVGVPLDAAIALVAAGIAGPRGLRDAEPEDVVSKVDASGSGGAVKLGDVKRWKRRA